jgi:DNA-directed RNA polymerase specialized sigma24 family protein
MSERNKLSKRIVDAVNQMPTKVRRVFILSHYQGLSLQGIAGTMGIQEREAESLLRCGNTLFYRTLSLVS